LSKQFSFEDAMQPIHRLLAATVLAGATLGLSPPATAQERPNLQPTRDAMIDYRVEGRRAANGEPQMLRMYISAGGRKTLIEPSDGRTQIIVDRSVGRTYILMMQQRQYMERPLNQSQPGGFEVGQTSANTSLTKKGTETIAGRRCTVWESRGQRTSTACITDEGLFLKGESQAPGGGERSSLIATNVQVGPLAPETFNVPYGFTRYETANIPGMPSGGFTGGNIPGLPSTPSMPSMPSGIQIPGGFTIPRP
jgi:hypothetical protein